MKIKSCYLITLLFCSGCWDHPDQILTRSMRFNSADINYWGEQSDSDYKVLTQGWKNSNLEKDCKVTITGLSRLSQVGLSKHDLLTPYFSASSKWRTSPYNINSQNLMAKRRSVHQGNWSTNDFTHDPVKNSSRVGRGVITFYENGEERYPEFIEPTIVPSGTEEFTIIPTYKYDSYVSSVYITVGKSQINIQESNPSCNNRSFTQAAINVLYSEIKDIDSSKLNQSDVTSVFSNNALVNSKDSLIRIRRTGYPGYYYFEGFINPGESGYIYLKIIDKDKHVEIDSDSIRYFSSEYVGWSNNSSDKFFFSSKIKIPVRSHAEIFWITGQLWFKPSNSLAPERYLGQSDFQVTGTHK